MKSIFVENRRIIQLDSIPISEGIRTLDQSPIKLLLIVNSDRRFVGTVTDGDVRRGILKGVSLQLGLSAIMNRDPIVAKVGDALTKYQKTMRKKKIFLLPVVNAQKELVDLFLLNDSNVDNLKENPVMILAGGLGTRLGELTKQTPKSLLPVGNASVIEIAIQNLISHGFRKFYISINYKAEMIRDFLGSGDRWGCDIQYLQEDERLGTAGPISLLRGRVDQPFLVMNGDIVTKIDFDSLLQFHINHGDAATMCVKEYDMQVPYGVVQLNENKVVQINEKPVQKFFVSAGIYMFDPTVIKYVPEKTYFDMPKLFELLIQNSKGVSAFPVMEYWLDIGRFSDLEKAQMEFKNK